MVAGGLGAGLRALIAVGAGAVALAMAAPAGAVTIGADLSGEPPETHECSNPKCAVTGVEPGAGHPFRAPADGRITAVRFRTPAPPESASVRILHQQGENFQVDSFFDVPFLPLGVGQPFFDIPVDIPVVETEILALELTGTNPQLGFYDKTGAKTLFFGPPLLGGEVRPPSQEQDNQIPAVQFEFEMVRPPLPEEKGDEPPPPPPPSADVAVTKSYSGEFGTALIGGAAPFYVLVENKGPNTAQGVVLKDSFGRGLTLKRTAVLKGSAGKPNCGGGGGRKGGTVTCNLGALAPGAKVGIDFFFVATGKSSKGAGKGVKRREKNVAVVSSTGPPDPNPKNNRAVAGAKVESGGAPCPARSRVGTPRRDKMKGTRRSETMLGLDGNDRIQGKRGRDCLFGGDGRDVLIGGPQADLLEGNGGNDLVLAVDGTADTIRCGKGRRDRVVADRRLDRVARNCERVRRR